jgi:2',3'-cyclic-nucleotide 2'-phosphodiesterase (5'-nucleotidase family)
VQANADVLELISQERARIAPIAERKLGFAEKTIARNRIAESPLANILTDAFREATKADMSFLNTGGIREDIEAGQITYEDLFRVLPFANHGLLIGPMPWKQIRGLLERSIKTCGTYGALMQSGLRVEFKRDCKDGTLDPNASLHKVSTVGGEVLLDDGKDVVSPERNFQVATLDFLAAGGSGYQEFRGVPIQSDLGIVREVIMETLAKNPMAWPNEVDGRWKQLKSFLFFHF